MKYNYAYRKTVNSLILINQSGRHNIVQNKPHLIV